MGDDQKLWLALGTSGLAFAGTLYTAIVSYRSQQKLALLNAALQSERDERTAQREARKVVSKFRDPLMHAAYDLQSRIFNILKRGFLPRYYTNGSAPEQEYAVENTVFLLAQFLGWTEAIRQEIQFLDLDADDQTRELRKLQDGIYTQLQTDRFGAGLRLFAGEQRAVGELMLDRTTSVCRCIGFASFVGARNPAIDRWLDPLRDDVKQMAVAVMSYAVSQRTREIAIRMALGATRREVLRLVLQEGIGVTMLGVAIGLAGALVMSRIMAGYVYGISSTDPLTFVAASAVLIMAAFLASFFPAHRATRVNSMAALRYE